MPDYFVRFTRFYRQDTLVQFKAESPEKAQSQLANASIDFDVEFDPEQDHERETEITVVREVIPEDRLDAICINQGRIFWREDDDQDDQKCHHEYEWSRYCGSKVCITCEDHEGLCRCYCGWSQSGGDGRAELQDMGEQIEADY